MSYYDEYFCPNCNAVLNDQYGFDPERGHWICTECGKVLLDDDVYDGDKYEGVAWFCDGCNALLNRQDGFDDLCSTWECTECGHINGIAEDNIVEEEKIDCPNCGDNLAKQFLFESFYSEWTCTCCGASLKNDYDEYIIISDEDENEDGARCPVCSDLLSKQSGFYSYCSNWSCESCGSKLVRSFGDDYEVVDEEKESEKIYHCPNCETILNEQIAFVCGTSVWSCEECHSDLTYELESDTYELYDDTDERSSTESTGYSSTSHESKKETRVPKMIMCHKCRKLVPAESRFCIYCGVKMKRTKTVLFCRMCGVKLLSGAMFCHSCGTKIEL